MFIFIFLCILTESRIELPSIQSLDMFQCYTDEPLSLNLPAETAQYIYIDVPSIKRYALATLPTPTCSNV